MKLLHFADLHLGVERHGHHDPTTGASTRLADFLAAFDLIIEAAIAERVDAIIFAGDAYKNRDPSPTHQREFARRVRRIAETGIPLVILIGNHDLPYAWGRATSVDIFETLAVPGVTIADRITTVRLHTASGPLQIVTLPWVTRSILLGHESLRTAGMDDVQEILRETVASLIAEEAARLDPQLPAVLTAHLSLHGATYNKEHSVTLGQDLLFTRSDLAADRFDYIALGHIHKHQVIGVHPPAVYAGSPERIDFGEEREAKGFVLVDIDTADPVRRSVAWRFCPLPARPFRTLRLRAFGSDPNGDLLRTIERARELDGAIVRLIIEITPEAAGQVRPTDLRRALRAAGVAHVAGIRLESESTTRARLPLAAGEELSPLQMLERYLAAKGVPAERTRRLLELAGTLLPAEPGEPATAQE